MTEKPKQHILRSQRAARRRRRPSEFKLITQNTELDAAMVCFRYSLNSIGNDPFPTYQLNTLCAFLRVATITTEYFQDMYIAGLRKRES